MAFDEKGFLESVNRGDYDYLAEQKPEELTPPTPKRGAFGEIGLGVKRGIVGQLPQVLGESMEWLAPAGSAMSEAGKGISARAEARMAPPEMQLHPEEHNAVVNALAAGGEMLGPSVVPPALVGLGLAALPAGAVTAATGLGIAALGGALPIGMQQAQQTYERVKAATGDEAKAREAGWKSGGIETLGETVGTWAGGKLLGIGAKAFGKTVPKFLGAATKPGVIKPFLKQLPGTLATEVGTEVGQNYGEAVVEKNAGVNTDPWEQGKAAIAPTIGLTMLLAPFGLGGFYKNARQAQAIDRVLTDPAATNPIERKAVVDMLYKDATGLGIPEADMWHAGAIEDIRANLPIRREALPITEAPAEVAPTAPIEQPPAEFTPAEREAFFKEQAARQAVLRRDEAIKRGMLEYAATLPREVERINGAIPVGGIKPMLALPMRRPAPALTGGLLTAAADTSRQITGGFGITRNQLTGPAEVPALPAAKPMLALPERVTPSTTIPELPETPGATNVPQAPQAIAPQTSQPQVSAAGVEPAAAPVATEPGAIPQKSPMAMRQQKGLTVKFGGKTYPVSSFQDASDKWTEFRKKSGGGASEIGTGVDILDASGKPVARISYNGRIWEPEKAKAIPITPVAEKPTIAKGTVGMKLGAGESVLTATGRQTTPFPKLGFGTNRKAVTTTKAVDAWLIENAKSEAEARKDKFNLTQFKAVNPKNITQSDKDSAEQYLFGTEQPPVLRPMLKPLVQEKPKAAQPAKSETVDKEAHTWWNSLSHEQHKEAITNAGLNIKVAAWSFISKTNREKILATRNKPNPELERVIKKAREVGVNEARINEIGNDIPALTKEIGRAVMNMGTKPAAAVPAVKPTSNALNLALNQYEDTGEIKSVDELADHVEALIADGAAPESLSAALKAYRDAQAYDREVSGRSDMDAADAQFIAAIRKSAQPEITKPAAKPSAAPKAESLSEAVKNEPAKPTKAAQDKARIAAEKDVFTGLSGLQTITEMVTAPNTVEQFKLGAEAEVGKWIGEEMNRAVEVGDTTRAKALNDLLKDGKPVLPDSFYVGLRKEVQQAIKQKHHTDLVAASKAALTTAAAGSDNKIAFGQGWDHALAGKTKSTLPNGAAYANGYAAAQKWLKTADGQAAYTRKRVKKLENTGADLRRWFDEQKAKIKDGDTETIMATLENATTRAELFRNVLTANSTPGAQRWLEGVRNQTLPFKRWLTEKAVLRDFTTYTSRNTSDTEKIRQYLDGKLDLMRKEEAKQTRDERIQTLRQAADEYVTLVALLTDKLDGTNVESLAKSLDGAVFKPGLPKDVTHYARAENYSEAGKQITTILIDDWRVMRNYGFDAKSYNLDGLIKHENDTIESSRKAPLTPPRLDRVDRDGEDYRKGKNVTPTQFKHKFGFADVGFGKWVNAKHDQDHLNYSYDAFRDLAKMLHLPDVAISLGNRLHFTIGALGHGKFAAHYAPAQPHPDGGTVPVINVTNTRGDGTVAHEWAHALDLTPQVQATMLNQDLPLQKAIIQIKNDLKYGYNFDGLRSSVLSMLKGTSFWTNDKGARKTEQGRIENAERSINYYARNNPSKYYKAARNLDGSKSEAYWSNDKELFARAFEAWIGDAMETTNTYLVNPAWSGDGAVTSENHRGTPYPVGEERERFNKWFDALSKSLVYDEKLKVLTLDQAKWDKNKPKVAEDWRQALADLRAELPAMLEGIKREQAIKDQQFEEEEAYADTIKVGDRVKPKGDREDQFRNKFGDAGAIVSEIRPSSTGGRSLYFEGWDYSISARNAEIIQRKEDIEAQAKAAAAEAIPAKVAPVGELSEAELSALFDEAAAELQESTQEQPAAPVPGEAIKQAWTAEDKTYLLGLINQGKIILLANDELGLPTIHDIKTATHIGFGLFRAETPEYTVNFDAGSAMASTPSGQPYTLVSVETGTFPYDRAKAIAILSGQKPILAPAVVKATTQTLETEKTVAKLASEAAKFGVTGIDEALTGLVKLFGGGKGKLQSFPAGLDEDTYKAAKPHFEASLKAFQQAGKTIKELFRFLIEQFGMGVKPYAVYFAKEMNLTADLGTKPSASRQVADYVQGQLAKHEKISWQELFAEADKAWGGSQAAGTYTVQDAYEAMEVGVNQYLRKMGFSSDHSRENAVRMIVNLTRTTNQLPTETKRTKEMDEYQQFSTPPALAYAASWVAHIGLADVLLEPSAGTGDLAIYASNMGAKLILNELSSRRAALLKDLYPDARVFTEDAEQLNNILPRDAVPTVVVMNPPFSATAGRVQGSRNAANGARHIEQALKRLPANGRLVAISGTVPADWLSKIKQSYNVRAMIEVSGKEYAKYGTTFDNQLIVIDNNGKTAKTLTGRAESIAELPALLEGIRNDRPIVSKSAGAQPEGSGLPEATPAPVGRPQIAIGGGPTDVMVAGREPTGATAGVGGISQRPVSGLGRTDTGLGTEQSEDVNAISDRDGRGKVLPGLGQSDTGRSSNNLAGKTNKLSPGATEKTGLKVESAETAKFKGELSNAIFENYKPQRLEIPGAKEHLGKLVQSSAMAAVEPPIPIYTPNLPKEVISKGKLSLAQLEGVVYAGQAHQEMLPNGERRGFFIGDGTGTGKGREISGIIMDNMRQGRNKAIWISASQDLVNDARRDFSDIGGDKKLIFPQISTKNAELKITPDKGILFTAYSMLSGTAKKQATDLGQKAGRSRSDQIMEWLGKDFDGVIIFDEAHKMGNSIETKGKRGKTKPSQQAIAGMNLQKMLPKARIVYVSATGATEIRNLAFAARLGLWGEDTAFADAKSFIENIAQGGVASMELISRDMKAMGMYISRSLSYDGVTYRRLEHKLTPLQTDIYNELAKTWQGVLQHVDAALKTTNGAKNGRAKSAAMAAFQASQLRFFNQIITSLQMPSVIEDIKQQLAAGHAAVIQLTQTNEASQNREVAKAVAEGIELEELDFTPRQLLMDYVRNSFPVQAYEQTTDAQGNVVFMPVKDANGAPVFDQDAIKMRDDLLVTLEQIRVPENPIDAIINSFGVDKVAEVTGRSRRFIQQRDEAGNFKLIEQKRGNHAAHNDAVAFQDDKKQILVFSEKGGTGFSYHADRSAKNQRMRIHYLLQPGWRADTAIQGLGRTHRTNQTHAPEYILITTNLKAQKRFVSSIARRLDQLGALTRGERQASSQGLFTAGDNLESQYAADALDVFFQDMYRGATSLNFNEISKAMGLDNLIDKQTGGLNTTNIPDIPRFLNRLLSLESHQQDAVFAEFEKRLDEVVNFAMQQGTYDNGMQTLKAESVKKVRDEVAYTDPRTKAETRYVEVDVTNPVKYRSWKEAKKWADDHKLKFAGWYKNIKGDIFGMADLGERINAAGQTIYRGALVDIHEGKTHYIDNLEQIKQGFKYGMVNGRYEKVTIATKITEEEAQKAWDEHIAVAPKHSTTREHMIVGVILPIWDRVKGHPRIIRLKTDDGERMIGRVMGPKDAKITLKNLGLDSSVAKMTPVQQLEQIKTGARAILANGWEIAVATVSNENRLEIKSATNYFSASDQALLEQQGAFVERIQWRERVFIPTANEQAVFERITKAKPVVELLGGKTEAVASEFGDSEEAGIPFFSRTEPLGLPYRPDAATLKKLRFDAAMINSPAKGIMFRVTEDGEAIVTGKARLQVPDKFQRFATEHGLKLIVRRANQFGGYSVEGPPMPMEYRESGALYAAEMGKLLDRTGLSRFSRAESLAAPATIETVQRTAESLVQGLARVPEIVTVQSAADLPFRSPQDAKGVWLRDKIYLVADNLGTAELVRETVAHELMGHFGLHGFFGKDINSALLNIHAANPRIRAMAAEWVSKNGDFISEVRREHGAKYAAEFARMRSIEEALSKIAQTGERIKGAQRFAAVVQKLLRAIGLDGLANRLEAKTDAEAMLMLRKAELFVRNGTDRKSVMFESLVPFYQTAWHGSPHEFERFDIGQIGTGEGSNSFGWGLYFADKKQIAEWYKKQLSLNIEYWMDGNGNQIHDSDLFKYPDRERALNWAQKYYDGDLKVALIHAKSQSNMMKKEGGNFYQKNLDLIAAIKEMIAEGVKKNPKAGGKIYQVELTPAEDEYLLWDKPLSEQSEKVQNILEHAGLWSNNTSDTGMVTYKGLQFQKESDKAASDYLHSLGIRGIKYLDNTSRDGRPAYRGDSAYLAAAQNFKENGYSIENTLTGMKQAYKDADVKELQAAINEAFDIQPKQTYNYVIFSDKDVSITARFSRAEAPTEAPTTPEETRTQAVQRKFQDRLIRFQVVQQAKEIEAAKAGGYKGDNIHEARDFMKSHNIHNPISDLTDVYQAASEREGIASVMTEDFHELRINPLVQQTHDANITMDDVSDFLKVQHAQEANARMRELKPNEKDVTAYGITDDEAKAQLAAYQARPDYAKLKQVANAWRELANENLQMKVDAGLIPQGLADAYRNTFEFYVPVKGEEEQQQGTGKGLSVVAREQRRLGHGLREEKIFENILRDYQNTISLIEKNRVAKIAGNFITEINDPAIGTIGKPVRRQVFVPGATHYMVMYHGTDVQAFDNLNDARAYVAEEAAKYDRKASDFFIDRTKDVGRVILQAKPLLADNEFQYYVNGDTVRAQWNDELLARAFKNLGVENVNTLLEGSRTFNSYLSKAYTGYSPTFLLKNPIRDAIQGAITNTSKFGIGMAGKIFAAYPHAIGQLSKHLKQHGSSAEVNRFRQSGSVIGAAYVSDTERIGKDVMTAYNEYAGAQNTYQRVYAELITDGRSELAAQTMALLKAGQAGFLRTPLIGHFLRFMEHANAVTENALRLATFNTLIAELDGNGNRVYTDAQAALAAKDLMNFNRKGELSIQAGALYLFFNPNAQGTEVLLTALTTAKHRNQARALAGTMVVSAFLLAEMMRGGGDDDEKKWKMIPSSIKDRNMIFGAGDTKFMLPVPYGYGVFHSLGNALSDIAHGENPWKSGVRLTASMLDNFSPVGNPLDSTHGAYQLLPTIPKMALAPSVNENAFGSQIAPDKYGSTKPDSQTFYRNTKGTVYAGIAAALNAATGGSKYEAGLLDVSPETLRYWMNSITGGAGQFALDTINTGMIGLQGVTPEIHEIPTIKSFTHEVGVNDARRLFWDSANQAQEAANEFAMAKKARDGMAARQILTEKRSLIMLARMASRQEPMLKRLRDAEDAIRLDESLSLEQKRAEIKLLEAREITIYGQFLRAFAKR